MKTLLGFLSVCLFAADAFADQSQDLLAALHSRSDVVVLGEFTSDPIGQSGEQGVIGYQAEFRIAELLKGEIGEQRKPGGTIVVNTIRFEFEPEDRLPYFKQGGRAILFLKCNDRQSPVTYTIFDQWFGIQPAFPTMAKTLAALPNKKTTALNVNVEHLSEAGGKAFEEAQPVGVAQEYLAENKVDVSGHDLDRATVARYALGQPTEYDWLVTFPSRGEGDPILVAVSKAGKAWQLSSKDLARIDAESDLVAAEKAAKPVQVELSDEWRIFLPAGYEVEMALKKIDDQRYTLQPANYTFSGTYRIEGDRLVSEELDDSHNGQFAWKIVSPYLLTLVDQHAGIGSDYSGAIMFRPCPTAVLEKLRRHELEENTSNQQKTGRKGVPQITVEQLKKEIRQEGFQWRFIGHEIEFTSSKWEGNRVHIDGMEKEILDTAVIHFGEGRVNRFDNLGEKIRVRGLIVDQWYGVWQIWPYSMTNVKE